jgi:GT2 family glycosyltransferase
LASSTLKTIAPPEPTPSRENQEGRLQVDGHFFIRDGQRTGLRGVTYGPFSPDRHGHPFPDRRVVRDDFAHMTRAGFNAVRVYHVPPPWILDGLGERPGLGVMIDVPWSKHLCFLDSKEAQREARQAVRSAAAMGRNYPCVLAYSICNEITPDVIRWHGRRRVEKFLTELMDVAKQADPHGLVTYANYPPTEYLDLSFLDFITFNVYLHDRETFRRYLCRLQNLVGDKPLVLGEIGMDTLRHGELEQADFLSGHLREGMLRGLAGAFIFSWTDEWHTGNSAITDWAFGVTYADRAPKASLSAVRELLEQPLYGLLVERPKVSVVVCSYNGGRTLEQCLNSLLALNYPDFEVIVVDDGSTDDTREILSRFPSVRSIHQPNQGLSVARNVGLQAATGSVVAYTDSDCFVDADWLTLLVAQFECSDAAAVGGPNLAPDDGWLADCVAASPGQPTHVLESDQVAEHIPGCNMAFRREALESLNGFDPQFRKAGDDVDVCWRLHQAGMWISFAPGAFVWHHRRQGPRTYLRQQAGYGEAEALLRFKHPDKFNGRGDGKWRGMMYGAALQGLRLSSPIIYSGTYATGFFQCIYQPGPAHWAMLPTTLEWHFLILLTAVVALFWPLAWGLAAMLWIASVTAAGLQAAQVRLARIHDGPLSRAVVFALCYAQPLVRSWYRYRTRLLSAQVPEKSNEINSGKRLRLPLSGCRTLAYWTSNGSDRTKLLADVNAYLSQKRWGGMIGSGWTNWDLEIDCHPGTVVRVQTVQENHGGADRLIRVKFRVLPRPFIAALCSTLLLISLALSVSSVWAIAVAAVLAGYLAIHWWRALRVAGRIVGVFEQAAEASGLMPYGVTQSAKACETSAMAPSE